MAYDGLPPLTVTRFSLDLPTLPQYIHSQTLATTPVNSCCSQRGPVKTVISQRPRIYNALARVASRDTHLSNRRTSDFQHNKRFFYVSDFSVAMYEIQTRARKMTTVCLRSAEHANPLNPRAHASTKNDQRRAKEIGPATHSGLVLIHVVLCCCPMRGWLTTLRDRSRWMAYLPWAEHPAQVQLEPQPHESPHILIGFGGVWLVGVGLVW
ncbi:hypothetical protein B0T26DRAFT_261399 [Lasiosphaeria miniovina]|uniref:Uncharacterized protein n=1 Tax=Lasiosphaeria miniovina TaxID=1954250 RepID=A0AA40E5R2_9PEZI|nr:uncharacterized protein B0T26DRAFT_261399 [Lasiosphaeria miniovina]KAK0723468.1 hypothetical protein B0T26DRAFT_261399 [Lasiosphaeria miniovina]